MMFAAFADGKGVGLTVAGGPPGFARPIVASRLRVPATALDEPDLARVGHGVGALFLAPGIAETLRVADRVVAVDSGEVEIAVDECYMHCAKALLRSNFWTASPRSDVSDLASEFLNTSCFMRLATADRQGCADVSPKGDPAGSLIRQQHDRAWFAERPGNRRADSSRNILVQPRIAAALLIPGSTLVARLSGMARLTTDAVMRADCSVAGKIPLLVTCIEKPELALYHSGALARAGCIARGGARSSGDVRRPYQAQQGAWSAGQVDARGSTSPWTHGKGPAARLPEEYVLS